MNIISQDLLSQINNQLDSGEQIIEPFSLDGQFHHFKHGKSEKSSSHIWAVGHTWEYKGNSYSAVTFGDWRDGSSKKVYSYDKKTESKAALKTAQEKIKQIQDSILEEKNRKHKDCAQKWENIFRTEAVPSGDIHGYLAYKQAKSNYRCHIRNGKTLLIPIEHPEHGFTGVQQIWKGDDGSYQKVFSKGIRIKSSYHRFTDFSIENENVLYLCEGYATACSIYQATKRPVIVCFFASNIIPSITSIRSVNRSIRVIVAGDNDHENPKNPGKHYAQQAARQFSNVIYRLPKFESGTGLSDFNDLHVTESIEKVAEQLSYDSGDFVNINPIGHKSGQYYYVNTQTNEIFSLTPSQHIQSYLIAQAKRKYWGQEYEFKRTKDGELTKHPDWDAVAEQMLEKQREVGFYNPENIRGIGAWIDGDSIVVNTGTQLIVNSTAYPISEHPLRTKYIYEAKQDIGLDLENSLGQSEKNEIIKCFELVNWKRPQDLIYFLGWITLSFIPGCVDWRPHAHLTGSRGTGKTTILSWLNDLVFTNGIGIVQDPTPAGIRQTVKNDALAFFLDEFEPGQKENRKINQQIMALMRQSSSRTQSKVVRGSASGEALSHRINIIAMTSGIQSNIQNAADTSRFYVFEVLPNNPDKFNEMKRIAANFESWQMRLFASIIPNISVIRQNQLVIQKELYKYSDKLDARQADQLSHLIAGYWELRHGNSVDLPVLYELLESLQIDSDDYVTENLENDEKSCLDAIMGVLSPDRQNIWHLIKNSTAGKDHHDLEHFGIRLMHKANDNCFEIFLSAMNANLIKALEHTDFADYAKILRRSKRVTRQKAVQRVNGVVKRGFVIEIGGNAQKEVESVTHDDLPF